MDAFLLDHAQDRRACEKQRREALEQPLKMLKDANEPAGKTEEP